jgi:hypothetical protein
MNKQLQSKSVADLEAQSWPAPPAGASPLVIRVHEARKKPLSRLSASDLRVLIGQDVGLAFVMPLALDVLEREPLIETDHYKGDLLAVVLQASPLFFEQNREMRLRVERILEALPAALDKLDHIDLDTTNEALEEGIACFRGR